jgi:hypothetical protein
MDPNQHAQGSVVVFHPIAIDIAIIGKRIID